MITMARLRTVINLLYIVVSVFDQFSSTTGTDNCDYVRTSLSPPFDDVFWSDSAEYCTEYWYWIIENVPSDVGIVLDIQDLQLTETDEMKIFDNIEIHRSYPVRNYGWDYRNTAPVLLYTNQAVVLVHTKKSSVQYLFSSFNISVSTHPLTSMPEGMELPDRSGDIGSRYRYNCSSSVDIPDVLRCDKVTQCIGGEDEANCSYLQQGCGDWVPYKDRCLKFVFQYIMFHTLDRRYDTFPFLAERKCAENYQATLVQIPSDGNKNFVGEIVKRSGFYTVAVGLRKVRTTSTKIRRLYRYLWQWGGIGGPIAYDEQQIQRDGVSLRCSVLSVRHAFSIIPTGCVFGDRPDGYVCSKPNPIHQHQPTVYATKSVTLLPASETIDKFPTKRCSDGSLVQNFHPCPHSPSSAAKGIVGETTHDSNDEKQSSAGMKSSYSAQTLPMFQCRYGQAVHYSLTCDGFPDCADESDETDCHSPRFEPLLTTAFVCRKLQIISKSKQCNGVLDCLDESDEEDCAECNGPLTGYVQTMCPQVGCVPYIYTKKIKTCPVLVLVSEPGFEDLDLAQVTLDGYGMSRLNPINETGECPETHYQCPGGFCIPTYLLNNGEQDCLQGEDENIPNDNFTCPGFYRCYQTMSCVHPKFVCDGIPHCPNRDDELFCDLECPQGCTCEGYAYTCQAMFEVHRHLHVRYLDLSGINEASLLDLYIMEILHFINLSSCHLNNVTLKGLQHLRVLDLSDNLIQSLTSLALEDLSQLLYLDLSNNPLVTQLDQAFSSFLLAARVAKLETLTMISISLRHLGKEAFVSVRNLISLDIRGNDIESFDLDVFQGLDSLRVLRADNSKLCCSLSASSSSSRCEAPADELSSCSDLLRSDFFRVFLWALALLAITGNVGVLIYRLGVENQGTLHGSRILVMNLSASDCLMGLYLTLIGIADAQYRGTYFTEDTQWRHSATCKAAGFLALLSSEVSAFVLCLITADRVLAVCFPLNVRLRTTRLSAMMACGAAWAVGVVLAGVPLLPSTQYWNFYSQNGICLPLPITRRQFPGQGYTFAVFIVLNFSLFLVIGCGQVLIFRVIRQSSAAAKTQRREHELTIARRLFVLALSDFCCWFPVGLMGLLAAGGISIPGQVNVWAAVFVLPVNSAINPFLYTLNAAAEKWRKRNEERRVQRMMSKFEREIERWPADKVEVLVWYCLRNKLAGRDVTLLGKRETTTNDNDVTLANMELSTSCAEAQSVSTSLPSSKEEEEDGNAKF